MVKSVGMGLVAYVISLISSDTFMFLHDMLVKDLIEVTIGLVVDVDLALPCTR